MDVKGKINSDLKAAMLAGDKTLATTLRGLKSALLNAEIAAGKREEGLEENEAITVLRKEAKRRQESADLYKQGGSSEKAEAELAELQVIEAYLPQQLSDEQLERLASQAIDELGAVSPQTMGQIIGRVKALSDGQADGGRIAAVVKKRLEHS